jgi:hypothetical protein
MKALLRFDLPEDERDYEIVIQAPKTQRFLWEFHEKLRSWQRNYNDFTSAGDALNKIREEFYRLLNEHDVNIDL